MASPERGSMLFCEFFFRLEPVFEVVTENPAMLPVDFMSAAQQIRDRSCVVDGKGVQIDSLGFRFISDLVPCKHVQNPFPLKAPRIPTSTMHLHLRGLESPVHGRRLAVRAPAMALCGLRPPS
jgi:hypothetical protein